MMEELLHIRFFLPTDRWFLAQPRSALCLLVGVAEFSLAKPFPPPLLLLFLPSHLFSSPPQSLSFLSRIPAGRSVSCDVTG